MTATPHRSTTRTTAARVALGLGCAGLIAGGLAAPAHATPGVGAENVYGCLIGSTAKTGVENPDGSFVSGHKVLFVLHDSASTPDAHTSDDVTVEVRSDGGDWTPVEHTGGDPVGSVTTWDIEKALGGSHATVEIRVSAAGQEELSGSLDMKNAAMPLGGADCASDVVDGEEMAPVVTWAPIVMAQPRDPGRPMDGSVDFLTSPREDAVPVPDKADGKPRWMAADDVQVESNDPMKDGQGVELTSDDQGGFRDAAWYGAHTLPEETFAWVSYTGADEEGTQRTRIVIAEPTTEETLAETKDGTLAAPGIPTEYGRKTDALLWGPDGLDSGAPSEDEAPADGEQPSEEAPSQDAPADDAPEAPAEGGGHEVPEKVETGTGVEDRGLWAGGALAMAALGGAALMVRRRFTA